MSYLDTIREKREQAESTKTQRQQFVNSVVSQKSSSERVSHEIAKQSARSRTSTQPVKVVNSELAKSEDIHELAACIKSLGEVLKPEGIDWQPVETALNGLSTQLSELPRVFPDAPEPVEEVTVKNLPDIEPTLRQITEAVRNLKLSPVFDPKITVKPADVKVTEKEVDLKPVVQAVQALKPVLESLRTVTEQKDDLQLLEAIQGTTKAINSLQFPVPNYVLPYAQDGKATQVTLTSSGAVPVDIQDATITTVDDTVATSTDVSLASSASSAQLIAANTSRKGLLLNNTDANPVYIYYGTTASLTKFTVRIPSNSYWEMPQPVYTGRIDAIWSADGSGSLIGSEL